MNNNGRSLLIAMRLCLLVLGAAFVAPSAEAQTPGRPAPNAHVLGIKRRSVFPWPQPPGSSSLAPAAGPSLPVIGSGTLGRLAKWTGFTSSNSVIGDTTIFEDKFGNVGIGTDSPTSKLTVNGTIQASGGSSILHDATLMGNGTSGSPLGVGIPLTLSGAAETLVEFSNNNFEGGLGLRVFAGNGNGSNFPGGVGVQAVGGNGSAVLAKGCTTGFAALGGSGGAGVVACGGLADGAGNRGGTGIVAVRGFGVNGATDGVAGDFEGDVKVSGNVKLGTNGQLFAPGGEENLRIIRGAVDPSGTITLGSGFTVQQGMPGDYTINFKTPFSGVPAMTLSADVGFAHVTCTSSTCSVLTLNTIPVAASLAFSFIAVGPR